MLLLLGSIRGPLAGHDKFSLASDVSALNLDMIAVCSLDDVVMADFFSPIWRGAWFDPAIWPATLPRPSAVHMSWLTEPGSLTARLKSQPATFTLTVVQQCELAFPSNMAFEWPHSAGLLREITMSLDGVPQVFAQSFLPQDTLNAFAPLAHLGNLPLGEYIFQQPDLTRHWLQLAWFEHVQLTPALQAQRVWGRRSLYAIKDHSFLVQEVFLQEMPA